MKSSSRIEKFLSLLIGGLLIGLFILLLSLINRINVTNNYYNRTKKDGNLLINYPYFNNENIDNSIASFAKNINKNLFDEVNYEVSVIDGFTSILFVKSKDGKITDYDSLIFDKEGIITNIKSIVSDENILKEKISIYLLNNNINITDYQNALYDYHLTEEGIVAIITSEENGVVVFTKVLINYNEITEILKISYEVDPDYTRNLTTIPTTTTTTTVKPDDSGEVTDKVIAFTFDDGPSKYTTLIMDVLDKYGAKATFFEVGYMMKNRQELVKEVLNRGHEVGNHTTDHSNLNKLSAAKVKEKVYNNNDTFKEITGNDFPLLRPPYGNCKTSVKELIDVPIIKWSVDSRDWESRNKDKIVPLVKRQTRAGDIVLFHDLYESTYESIKELVPYYYENGYKIVTVSELFKIYGKELESGHIYYSAK